MGKMINTLKPVTHVYMQMTNETLQAADMKCRTDNSSDKTWKLQHKDTMCEQHLDITSKEHLKIKVLSAEVLVKGWWALL